MYTRISYLGILSCLHRFIARSAMRIFVLTIGVCCLGVLPAWGTTDFTVREVVLAQDIVDRNPQKVFSPPAYCEKDKSGKAAIPVIESSQASKIYVWTKIESTLSGSIRHTWHHHIDEEWQAVFSIDLNIRPSPGFRTWSARTLRPTDHGEWMVVIAPSKEPARILCITRFTVR